ncbi:hypothetical protein FCIRC_9097 [Fusarium circinatum]|uniref:Uncharacterized protein n=1 Tax=Fusarium circinatum TaxID=48490 RepID=A0A8H5TEY3_FUSCI|nr:hypothetical protein FCIRC_9097 [Fusarium circinatum]
MASGITPGQGPGRSKRSKRAAGEGHGADEESISSSSRQRPDTPTPIGGSRQQTPVPLPQVPGSGSSRPPVTRPGALAQSPVTTPGSRGPVPRMTGSAHRSSNIPLPASTVRSQAGTPSGATFTGTFSGPPRSAPHPRVAGKILELNRYASGLTPSNSGQSLHRFAVTSSAGRPNPEQGSPGTPGTDAQETVPSASWKPSRENLMKLQHEPNLEFKWDDANKRCVVVGASENYTLELDATIVPEPNLPPGATAEETSKLNYYVAMMLFRWHSNRFVGFYARLGWVIELADNHPELLDMLDDVSAENQARLTNALLARLDATSFSAVFHHVRHCIDFNRTRDRADQQGHYFIKTMFLNLVTGLLKIWASERAMNLGVEADDNGNFKLKAKPGTRQWETDATMRNRLRERF